MMNFTLSELDNMCEPELHSLFNQVSKKLARKQQLQKDCSAIIGTLHNIQMAILRKMQLEP